MSTDAEAGQKAAPNDVIRSAARALEIVDSLATHADPVTARELAAKLGIRLATVYHLLNTLVYSGYAVKMGAGYRLSGDKINNLCASFMRSLRVEPVVVNAVQRLSDRTRETVYAARLIGDAAVVVTVAEGSQALRVGNLYPGLRGSEHARAAGKVLLAFLPEDRLNAYIRHNPMTPLTPHTITDRDTLSAELLVIRERGYAVDHEEFVEGVYCLSVPIMRSDAKMPTLAISVAIPSHRFATVREAHLHSLQEVRHELEAAGDRASWVEG